MFSGLYDSKRREFLGRDGARWGKLGIFYFFFYLGLAGFFCAMLAVFMALSPRDSPRYYSESSRMATRSNPLSPGLGFRPQPDVEKNIIFAKKNAPAGETNAYAKSLDQYLSVFYPDRSVEKSSDDHDDDGGEMDDGPMRPFSIKNPGDCTSANQYGYNNGKPCILIKMNKIVGFEPEPGLNPEDQESFNTTRCPKDMNGPTIHCFGEYPADIDNLGNINYISEQKTNSHCGVLEQNRFPYQGKVNRQDRYQAPYIWVQFTNPKPNILINIMCRVFGRNIDFDRKTGRALTRFQIYVEDLTKRNAGKKSRKSGDI